jgi:hypothetical protein
VVSEQSGGQISKEKSSQRMSKQFYSLILHAINLNFIKKKKKKNIEKMKIFKIIYIKIYLFFFK